MKIFEMIGKYHYQQVAENKHYRKAYDPSNNWTEEDSSKFQQFLKNLEDMNEDKNDPNQ